MKGNMKNKSCATKRKGLCRVAYRDVCFSLPRAAGISGIVKPFKQFGIRGHPNFNHVGVGLHFEGPIVSAKQTAVQLVCCGRANLFETSLVNRKSLWMEADKKWKGLIILPPFPQKWTSISLPSLEYLISRQDETLIVWDSTRSCTSRHPCTSPTCSWSKQGLVLDTMFSQKSPTVISFWHTFPERCQCPQLCSPVRCSCPSAHGQLRGETPCLPHSPQCPVACLEGAALCWSHTYHWTGSQTLGGKRWRRSSKDKLEDARKKEKNQISSVQKAGLFSCVWGLNYLGTELLTRADTRGRTRSILKSTQNLLFIINALRKTGDWTSQSPFVCATALHIYASLRCS